MEYSVKFTVIRLGQESKQGQQPTEIHNFRIKDKNHYYYISRFTMQEKYKKTSGYAFPYTSLPENKEYKAIEIDRHSLPYPNSPTREKRHD